jgi:polysaccharide deacetylase family protein (PEP-CTERM system associated)
MAEAATKGVDARPAGTPASAATAREAPASAARDIIANAMSVDVEDWFQVQAFADRIDRADWDGFAPRVERNTEAVLDLFGEAGVKATFFTLGWVAERFPQLVRRIVADGHELASHGWAHVRVDSQTPEAFRQDIRRTKGVLEDVGAVAVAGYRAATFSIGARETWAFKVLAEEGYAYSSSIYPIRHDFYGMPDAPRFPFRPAGAEGTVEIPMTTVQLAGRNLPCSGGGYFRLLPYPVSRWQLRRVNRVDRQPCIFYFHPWEIDPEQPRQRGVSAKTAFRHYTGLGRMRGRLRRLLRDFSWTRMDRAFPATAGRA